MFKQIFESKITEKLNTFNSSGKQAMEWMDKFRQSLDITEKIQQQFQSNQDSLFSSQLQQSASTSTSNSTSPTSTVNSNLDNYSNNITGNGPHGHGNSGGSKKEPSNTNGQVPNGNISRLNSVKQKQVNKNLTQDHSVESQDSNYLSSNGNGHGDAFYMNGSNGSYNNSPPNSFNNLNDHQQPIQNGHASKGSVKRSKKLSISGDTNGDEFAMLSSSSSLSQKSDVNGNHHHQLQQSKSIASEDQNGDSNGSTYNSRVLLRQSTDLTSSFPLKPFQKINSETVEIPGLNVKVVRYRIQNDLGKIEPHLYIKYNMGGIDANPTLSKGKLFFTLRYNEEIQSLSVTINRAELYYNGQQPPSITSNNLNANSMSAPSSPNLSKPDTYIKIQMLPDKKRKYQTRIQRKTWTPVFEETFYFQTSLQDLQNKTLFLSMLEFGRFSKHELLGAVKLNDIHTVKDLSSMDVDFVRNLLPLADDDLELGELTLTLCYLPAAGRLTVTVVKAINLKAMDINGKSDPYVKVTLVSRGKRLKKKKTSVMKNTLHPVYNESMLFDIPQDQIEQVDMIVKVIDYDRVGSNELIGCIGIGPSFSGIGRDHWYRMLENPRKPMTQAYYLRDSNFLREGLPAKIERALNSDRQESLDSKNSDL